MAKKLIWIIMAVLVVGGVAYWLSTREAVAPAEFVYKDLLRLETPQPNALISSPLTVKGEARGFWFFEASFPVRLLDGNGREIALNPPYIMTASEWMTEDFVPFEATLTFEMPQTDTGTLILEKDNPSGLPEHADSVSIPVRFAR
jgi:hypothetical protein